MRRVWMCVILIPVFFFPISLLKIEYMDSFIFSNKYQIMESVAYFVFIISLAMAKILEHQKATVRNEHF